MFSSIAWRANDRPGTEDIIHYFTLMSSELHYLDIILKMEKFTLMSSEFGENCLYFCDFACIFVILPVYLRVCPSFCYLVTVRASVSSCSCWFTNFCRQNVASCIYAFFKNKNLNFSRRLACLTPVFLLKIYENLDIIFDNLHIIFENWNFHRH